jgi:lipoyl(octanoyl) transferase
MLLSFLHLGRLDYATALKLQQTLVELRHQGRIGNVLLLLEHPPVLTLGRNSDRTNILASDELLARRGVEVHEVNRGGDVTYHGPGQLVGYPIFDLRSFSPRLGAVDYVRLLEEVLIRSCAEYGVLAQRIKGRTGVWTVAGGSVPEKKIAAIGVHISRGISSHGFAFNITTDLRDFDLIVPCGIADRTVTSLECEVDSMSMPSFDQVANTVAWQFGHVLKQQVLGVDSLQDLLDSSPPDLRSPDRERQEQDPELRPASPQSFPEDPPLRIPKELKQLRREEESLWA